MSWERDGDIAARGWLTRPDRLSLAIDPVDIDLLDAVVGWASEAAGVRVSVTVLSTERYLTEALVRLGYTPDEAGPLLRRPPPYAGRHSAASSAAARILEPAVAGRG
ncbi:MAG TPA: hypothetical protein VIR00_02700 [Micromonosporaceae bacterium]